MSAANRRRGADAERAVVNYLRNNGFPNARRFLAGDGRQPGDIDGVPGVCIEVKDVAQSRWPSWRAQLLKQTPEGNVSVLVRRTRGVRDVGMWDAQIPWWLCDPFLVWDMRNEWAMTHLIWCVQTGLHWATVPFRDVVDLLNGGDEK